jgi:hypothetical protein
MILKNITKRGFIVYVDDKRELPKEGNTAFEETEKWWCFAGNKWMHLQTVKFKANSHTTLLVTIEHVARDKPRKLQLNINNAYKDWLKDGPFKKGRIGLFLSSKMSHFLMDILFLFPHIFVSLNP